MTRFVPVTLLVVLAASGVASADVAGTTLPNSATLSFYKLYINEDGNGFKEASNPTALRKYFNLPHCKCSQMNLGNETQFEYSLRLDKVLGVTRSADIWVGPSTCNDSMLRSTACRSLTTDGIGADSGVNIPDISSLVQNGPFTLKLSTYDVFAGFNKGKGCLPEDSDKTIWILSDTANVGSIDYALPQIAGKTPGDSTTTGTGMDTNPPPTPLDLTGSPSENEIDLSWTVPTARASDIYAYQALCAKADGTLAKTDHPDPLYQTTSSLCGLADDPSLLVASGSTSTDVDAGTTIPLPTALSTLEPTFICGEQDASTANSMQLKGLENGVAYYVLLLAVDLHGNYSGTYLTDTITPMPVTDFWEDLHDRGSKVEGGFCLLAETYGDNNSLTNTLRAFRDDTLGGSRAGRWLGRAYYATLAKLGTYVHGSIALRLVSGVLLAPVVAFALLWHWLTLPGLLGLLVLAWAWRRRRRLAVRLLRLTAAAGVMVIAFTPSRAHAGGGYAPYWENSDPTADAQEANQTPFNDPSRVSWHAGVRIGPYVPDIDKQAGLTPGPYKQMYGGPHPLPMLDVDRILWTGFGQVGVGGTIGYMQRSAHAFLMGSDPADPNRPRAPGVENSFHLLPFALTATYRFTWLDEEYGIPVVPYVRGGLSYYVWWINAPSGDNAMVCKGAGVEPDCAQNKARGASLGVQGSIGLAIRAERIDASTAISMQASGIQHAGIYGELSLAKVDGFGSDTKLSVGARTWFAGVDFEF